VQVDFYTGRSELESAGRGLHAGSPDDAPRRNWWLVIDVRKRCAVGVTLYADHMRGCADLYVDAYEMCKECVEHASISEGAN